MTCPLPCVLQVGDPTYDHSLWRRPEDITTPTQVYVLDTTVMPGSDLLAGTAAALASISMVFRTVDAGFASTCLTKAKALYALATQEEDVYNRGIPEASGYYKWVPGRSWV